LVDIKFLMLLILTIFLKYKSTSILLCNNFVNKSCFLLFCFRKIVDDPCDTCLNKFPSGSTVLPSNFNLYIFAKAGLLTQLNFILLGKEE
jgi:hypothetical protein